MVKVTTEHKKKYIFYLLLYQHIKVEKIFKKYFKSYIANNKHDTTFFE
jgi:hypothetical protein